MIYGGSESPNSWISWRGGVRNNRPGASRRVVDLPKDSYSSRLRSGHRPVIATYEGYSTVLEGAIEGALQPNREGGIPEISS